MPRNVVTNDVEFKAGALVLADEGVCCLDELDNMASNHRTLLEVMEQQEVCEPLTLASHFHV
jgi:DNA replicative helicase MCM subunit Mcm2 (Cdc46/Mcm family)